MFNQSRFICQVLCSGMQVISALVLGGSIGQSRFICQVLCSGMQVISALVLGGSLAKEGLSAKFGVAVFKASILDYVGGSIGQSRFVCQVWCSNIPDRGIHLPKYVLPSFVCWYLRQIYTCLS